MGLKRVSWVWRYQGQCRAVRPLGHQGYRLRSHKKDQPLCSGYMGVFPLNDTFERRFFLQTNKIFEPLERLPGGRFAANIVIKCSTKVLLRVWFFGFSLLQLNALKMCF